MKFQFFSRCSPVLAIVVLTIAFLMTFSSPSRATTVALMSPEELVAESSFVGIVECETAGGIVAKYRVVESWKGAPVGTRFNLKTPFDYWEPQFPIALAGQRFVITASANQAPSRVMSTTSGGGVPLWWRNIPYEYSLPLFQGKASVPTKPGKNYYGFGEEYSSFAEFRAKIKKLASLSQAKTEMMASLSPEQREIVNLRLKFLEDARSHKTPKLDRPEIVALKKRIETATTAAQITNALLTLKWKDPKLSIGAVLSAGGGAETLKFLLTLKDEQWPFKADKRAMIIRDIQSSVNEEKLKTDDVPRRSSQEIEEDPTLEELAHLRDILQSEVKSEMKQPDDAARAIEILTKHDPAVVAEYLVNWKNPDKSWSDSDRGYVLGSYFAWQCGGERAVHLRALLKAQDPFVRVAGAVYLCFENTGEGMSELQNLSKLPGDPGVWAALNLARRGDKTAMPRSLQVLETAGKGNMEGVPHRNLQKRLLVLLSNSAKQSGVAQALDGYIYSGADEEAAAKKQYQHIKKWWQENQEQMTLNDPWLPLLEKQKVD